MLCSESNYSTSTELSEITLEFGSEIHNISTFTIDIKQEQTRI